MSKHAATVIQIGVLAGIITLVGVGLWQVHGTDPMLLSIERRRTDIMSTNCHLRAIVPANRQAIADKALEDAEASLRQTEKLLSAWLPGSDIRRLNDQGAGQVVMLDPQTVEILAMSKDLAEQTGGAFDVTCAPLFNVWRKAGETGKSPSQEALDQARQACGWDQYKLDADSAMKFHDAAKVDLGGIAKGYGIDRAVEAMRSAGVVGGLVEVGGDIRCFGSMPGGGKWPIRIENPFNPNIGKPLGKLLIEDLAVCTSGNYERYVVIDGTRYSHIVDPRTHTRRRPADSARSVTVVAPTAAEADAWATALFVVAGRAKWADPPAGPQAAVDMLEGKGIEAMIVMGTEENPDIHTTPGFDALLDK